MHLAKGYNSDMPTIIVASKNPVKIRATLNGFQEMFPGEEFFVEGVNVQSEISEQPMTNAETIKGAENRAKNAQAIADGDFFVGLEGGVEEKNNLMHSFAWIVVRDNDGNVGMGKTGEFILPQKVKELINSGMELGEADDIVFGKNNSKQANGAVGILSGDVIDRLNFYKHAVILALIPFKNPVLYQQKVKSESTN